MALTTIYRARDETQAQLLIAILQSHGIEGSIEQGARATAAMFAPGMFRVGLGVLVDETQAKQARRIAEEFDCSGAKPSNQPAGRSWVCPNCGETIEPQFSDCWNCQTPRPDDSAAAQPPRRPPDPLIPIDLDCINCHYNLRGLTIDRPCPECGHPSFASLFHAVRIQPWPTEQSEAIERALQPCLDAAESYLGFPLEAASFVIAGWRRAVDEAARTIPPEPREAAFHEVDRILRELAVEFVGDPILAQRTLEHWGLGTAAELKRLVDKLSDLRLLAT